VIDGKHQITDTTLNIFSDNAPTQVFNASNTKLDDNGKLDLNDVLQQLGNQGIGSVLIEAGPGLIGAIIESRLIDEFIIYTAPIIMGSNAKSMIQLPIDNMEDKLSLNISDLRMVGDDIRITATIKQ
jgi:diaminohydroxyphosphoribosylaminopyrimidine deaminase/5-amino-6-(5-phosphoribosylamino)uracil reductase